MKKLILLTVTSIMTYSLSFSQPCPDNIWFETQEQIDNFQINYPNCTEIEGYVDIGSFEYSNITNVDGLNVLTSVGSLWIWENGDLVSLEGFSNLLSTGNLIIQYNNALSNLAGFENLTNIDGNLHISNNSSLTDITALNSLTNIGTHLIIDWNYGLSNLSGLDNITEIGGDLIIRNNNILTNILALENISSINGDLLISGNPILENLTGLGNINSESIENLNIANNSSLTDCEIESVCNYLNNTNGFIRIYNNASGCNNPSEIADSCGITLSCLPFGDYYFMEQSDINDFQSNHPECYDLNGRVIIRSSEITNLEGLSNISSIEGDLYIHFNSELVDFSGLDNLTNIGGKLEVTNNSELESLLGLNSLSSIGDKLKFELNESLLSLQGLNSLTSIGNYLTISYNNSLNTLAGIENIDANSIQSLWIGDNPYLSNCDIESICSYLVDLNGSSVIHENAPGCDNWTEVVEACDITGTKRTEPITKLTLYPNPAKNELYIINNTIQQPSDIIIYNQLGQKILINEEISEKLDISTVPPGLYIVELVFNNFKLREKLMINR